MKRTTLAAAAVAVAPGLVGLNNPRGLVTTGPAALVLGL